MNALTNEIKQLKVTTENRTTNKFDAMDVTSTITLSVAVQM